MQNKYIKFLLVALVVAIIIPQITLAAWWNPFSWNIWSKITKIFYKPEPKTEILENRIKELEDKLNVQPTASPKITEGDKAVGEKTSIPTQQPIQKSVQQPIQQPTQQQDVQTPQYKKLLMDRITEQYATTKIRLNYSDEIISIINGRISDLNSLISKNQYFIDNATDADFRNYVSNFNNLYSLDVKYSESTKNMIIATKNIFGAWVDFLNKEAVWVSQTNSISSVDFNKVSKDLDEIQKSLSETSTKQDGTVSNYKNTTEKWNGDYQNSLSELKRIIDYLSGTLNQSTSQANQYYYIPHSPTIPTVNYIPPVRCYFRWSGTSGAMECYQ